MTNEQIQARIDKMKFTYMGKDEEDSLRKVLSGVLLATGSASWGGITGSIGDQTDLISGGKILASLLPAIAITDTFVESSESAMLALTAETGDICVRTDETKTYILKGTDPSVLADWELLLTPTGGVVSVFGRSGAVTAQSGDYSFSQISGTAGPTQGGTGLTAYAKGDVLIATGTNILGVVSASSTDGYVFTWDAASGLPMWKAAGGGGSTVSTYNLVRNLPSSAGQSIDLGSFTLTAGDGFFDIWVTVLAVQTKKFSIPIINNATAGTWKKALAQWTTGVNNSNDVSLEVMSSGNTTSFRLRQITGSQYFNYETHVRIDHQGVDTDVFTESSATSTTSAPSATYAVSNDPIASFSASYITQGTGYQDVKQVYRDGGTNASSGLAYSYTGSPGYPCIQFFARPSDGGWSWTWGGWKQTTTTNEQMRLVSAGLQILNGLLVGISDGTRAPSSLVELRSTTLGFLPPRMTLSQWNAITSPAEALQGWNTTDHGQMWYDGTRSIGFRYNGIKFQGYDGASWIDLN